MNKCPRSLLWFVVDGAILWGLPLGLLGAFADWLFQSHPRVATLEQFGTSLRIEVPTFVAAGALWGSVMWLWFRRRRSEPRAGKDKSAEWNK